MAGHSKWANIKHRKGAADKKRASQFTKLSKELMVSAKLGGSDPASNSRLRIAISKARGVNMPNDTIDRAIKKGAGELEGQNYEEVVYELYAPGGVGVIVEALTDKKTRTTPEIKAIVNKHNWNLAEPNAVSRLFELKGYIALPVDQIGEEELMEIVAEAGADDLRTGDEYYEIICNPEDYTTVSEAIQDKGVSTSESGIRFLPIEGTEVSVDDAEMARKILKVLDILEDNEDVQAVYNNLELSDEVAEALGEEN